MQLVSLDQQPQGKINPLLLTSLRLHNAKHIIIDNVTFNPGNLWNVIRAIIKEILLIITAYFMSVIVFDEPGEGSNNKRSNNHSNNSFAPQ